MFLSFDFFPKVMEDQPFRKTQCGGLLFIVTFFTIFLLIINEIYLTFLRGDLVVKQLVDTINMDERIRVNLNISFHNVPCNALTLDLQDVTGTHLEDVQYTLHKLRLDRDGNFIDRNNAIKVANFEKYINYPSNPVIRWYRKYNKEKEIDDCYGAQIYEGQRCITCQDVMTAYAAREWPCYQIQPPKEAIAQCMPDKKAHVQKVDPSPEEIIIQIMNGQIPGFKKITEQQQDQSQQPKNRRILFTEDFGQQHQHQQLLYMQDVLEIEKHSNEGCQVYGHFFIKKVPGNFHIGFHGKGQAAQFLVRDFSIAHTINLLELTSEKEPLSLGTLVKSTNFLDGTTQNNENKEDSQYYMKIVSGKYNTPWQDEKTIYSFVAHEIKKQSDQKLPSIVFKYEFDAITMSYTTRYRSFSEFIVSILAIIGGVFAVSNMFAKLQEKVGF